MMNGLNQIVLEYKRPDCDQWEGISFADSITVGSGENANLRLADGDLGLLHFEIRQNPTGIYLKDLDEKFGVTVLGEEVLKADNPVAILPGQDFLAGTVLFRLTLSSEEETNEPVMGAGTDNKAIKDQLLFAADTVGRKRLIFLISGIVILAVCGALLIYFLAYLPSQKSAVSSVVASTMASTDGTETLAVELETTPTFGVDQTAEVEALNEILQVPGQGSIDVESLGLGGDGLSFSQLMQLMVNPEDSLTMALDLYGENVAYMYIYTGVLENGRVITTVMEHIQAEDSQLVDGVLSPDWGDDPQIPLQFDWKPFVNEVTDGNQTIIALLMPETYSRDVEKMTFHVEGIFQPVGSETQYEAFLRFDGLGKMLDLLTFGPIGSDRGTPYKVNPQDGDIFTVYEQEFLINPETEQNLPIAIPESILPKELQTLFFNALKEEEGYSYGMGEFVRHEGQTLTFGRADIEWQKNDNYAGDYVAGFAVQDLDGNFYVGYMPILVDFP